jgi:hypothetical protein
VTVLRIMADLPRDNGSPMIHNRHGMLGLKS